MSTRIPSESTTLESLSIVDWKVVAAWIETEGSIDATVDFKINPRTGNYWVRIVRAILIGQGERGPLGALQQFLISNEIYSYLRLIKPSKTALGKKPYWRLEIQRMEDIDNVLDNTKGYLLTEKAKKQMEFYLHTRHMNSEQLRAEFLQGWLESRKNKKRRGRKGQLHVY